MNIAILNLPFEVNHALGDPSQWRLHMFAFLCAVDIAKSAIICAEGENELFRVMKGYFCSFL